MFMCVYGSRGFWIGFAIISERKCDFRKIVQNVDFELNGSWLAGNYYWKRNGLAGNGWSGFGV